MAAGGYSEPRMVCDISSHPNVIITWCLECHWGGGGGGGGGYKRWSYVLKDIVGIYLTHPLPKVFYNYVLIRYCKGCTFGLAHS